ncbi:MAG: ClpXP protease specificity-enhancing factor [Betaproteobacteria bacterium]|nr:ClpXP protease specificity-enhancing factor [Betaproteobacteria bacterium]
MSSSPPDLPSTKPYLLRALWEWCSENGFTPYMTVAVDDHCRVPREFVKNGEIVLNIGMEATRNLSLKNDAVSFQARFSGAVRDIYVPIPCVIALYARENGVGMSFPVEEVMKTAKEDREEEAPSPNDTPPSGSRPPSLRRVK